MEETLSLSEGARRSLNKKREVMSDFHKEIMERHRLAPKPEDIPVPDDDSPPPRPPQPPREEHVWPDELYDYVSDRRKRSSTGTAARLSATEAFCDAGRSSGPLRPTPKATGRPDGCRWRVRSTRRARRGSGGHAGREASEALDDADRSRWKVRPSGRRGSVADREAQETLADADWISRKVRPGPSGDDWRWRWTSSGARRRRCPDPTVRSRPRGAFGTRSHAISRAT